MNIMTLKFLVVLICFITILTVNAGKIVIIGDSTVASYPTRRAPLCGWGQAMKEKLKDRIEVLNLARSGYSSKSYINARRWSKTKKQLKSGDMLLIQFGHNDEKADKTKVGSSLEEFKQNLKLYTKEAKAMGVKPVLISPVCRRYFKGKLAIDSHKQFALAVEETAKNLKVSYVPLNALSLAWLEKLGPTASKNYYMVLAPGKYPAYPKGRKDSTHFNIKGANAICDIVLNELKKQNIISKVFN